MAIETTLVGEITTALYKKKYYQYPSLKYVEPDTGYVVYSATYDGTYFLVNPLDPGDTSGDFGQLTARGTVTSGLDAYDNAAPGVVGSILFGRIDRVSGTVYALSRTGSVLSEAATRFTLPATEVRTGLIRRIGDAYYFRTGSGLGAKYTPFDPETFEVDAASAITPGNTLTSQDAFLLHSGATGKSYQFLQRTNPDGSGRRSLVAREIRLVGGRSVTGTQRAIENFTDTFNILGNGVASASGDDIYITVNGRENTPSLYRGKLPSTNFDIADEIADEMFLGADKLDELHMDDAEIFSTADRPGTLTINAVTMGRDEIVTGGFSDPDGIRSVTSAVLTARDRNTRDMAVTRTSVNEYSIDRIALRNDRWKQATLVVVYVDAGDGESKTLTQSYSTA